MPAMNVLDYVFLGLVLVGAVRGAIVGLSRQLFGLAMVVAAIWTAGHFYARVAAQLASGDRMAHGTANVVAYILVFAGVCVLFILARLLLRALIRFGFAPTVERIGGALVGMAMAAVSASSALVALSLIPQAEIHAAATRESWVGRRLCAAFPGFYEQLQQRYKLPDLKGLAPESGADTAAPSGTATGDPADAPTADPAPIEPVPESMRP